MWSDGDDVSGRGVLTRLRISDLSNVLLDGLKCFSKDGVDEAVVVIGKDHWGRGRNEDWEERGESGSGQCWGAQSWLGLLSVGMRGLRGSPGVLR